MDPLLQIRTCILKKHEFVESEENIFIAGQQRLDGSSETCFKKTLKTGGYYSVSDIIFYLKNQNASLIDYRSAAQEKGVSAITNQDKTSLHEYLNGIVETCEQIDLKKQKEQRGVTNNNINSNIDNNSKENNNDTTAYEDNDTITNNATQLEELRLVAEGLRKVVDGGDDSEDVKSNFKNADQAYLKMLMTGVTPAYTRTTIMERSNADFSFGIELFKQVLRDREEEMNKNNSSSGRTPNSNNKRSRDAMNNDKNGKSSQDSKRKASGPPIIIVPNSLTTTVSSINVKDLLENGTFINISDKKKQGGKRSQVQTIKIKINLSSSSKQEFKVVDNPATLKAHEWENVVAIIVTGQTWQFKPLKWSNPVDLFNHVLGIHFTLDSAAVAPTVHSWKCKIVKLSNSMRHLDTSAVNDVVASLRKHMTVNKPWLFK